MEKEYENSVEIYKELFEMTVKIDDLLCKAITLLEKENTDIMDSDKEYFSQQIKQLKEKRESMHNNLVVLSDSIQEITQEALFSKELLKVIKG